MTIKTKRFIASRKNCSCSMPGVWRAVAYCDGAVVIFHSPRACSHIARSMDINAHYRSIADELIEEKEPVPLLSSQLEEQHSIFGGAERLRQCIRYAVGEHHPKLIVVASSCVAGVIGDDVEAAAQEAEEGYGVPVIVSESCGFLDGEYYQGYFEIADKLIDRFFKPRDHEPGMVILLGDNGGPWGHYAKEVTRLLNGMQIRVLGQFPGYWPADSFADVTRAEAAVVLGGRGLIHSGIKELADRLDRDFGVKYLPDCYPLGWRHTLEWLRGMGRLLHREEAAETVVVKETERFEKELEKFRLVTAGKKTVLCVGRWLQYYHPAATLEMIQNLRLDLMGVIMLDAYSGTEKEKMVNAIRQHSDAPIYTAAEGETLMQQAELILTTHELQDRSLRQLFLPMLPMVGTVGEIQFMNAVYRMLRSKICRGGVMYV